MRLWFSRQSDISIREQLATQIVLAIVSGELAPGERLPSTRELARRFRLHPNTVSAGYQHLERTQWLEFRKGSGVYVRRQPPRAPENLALDRLITQFLRSARQLNLPLTAIRARLRQWLEIQPPDHFLLIEPDQLLAQIVIAEIQPPLRLPVKHATELAYSQLPAGAIPLAIAFSAERVQGMLADHGDLLVLHLRSAGDSLAVHLPARSAVLVGIASAWPPFLKNARTMLISAGFAPDSILVRDCGKPGWQRGLNQVAAVICDSITRKKLNGRARVLSFSLVAEESIEELRNYERFVLDPLAP